MKLPRLRYAPWLQKPPGFWFGVLEYDPKGWEAFKRDCNEAYYLQVPLPSWQIMWSPVMFADCWHRLYFVWHGWHGAKFIWRREDFA